MFVENWPSEIADQAKPINDGAKQVPRDQILFADGNFVFLAALLHYDLPNAFRCIAVSEHELY
jgi:hypothetical protein